MFKKSLLVLIAAPTAVAAWSASTALPSMEFEELEMILEINVTDEDGEIILVTESPEAVDRLVVIDPLGKAVYQVHGDDPGGAGLSEIRLQSGEPDIRSLFSAFPEGEYTVRARTLSGAMVTGTAFLSHDIPARWFMDVQSRTSRIARERVEVFWDRDPNADGYTIEVEDDDEEVLRIQVPEGMDHFTLPSDFLEPETEYQLVMTARGANGNWTTQEMNFTTGR